MEHHHEIEKIAYELYLMRDGAPGDPVSDWILAERIYEERKLQEKTILTAQTPATVVQTAKSRGRTSGMKAAPAEKITKRARKPETKAAPVKAEKVLETPKAKKATRKKSAGNPVE